MSTQTLLGKFSPVRKLKEVSWHDDLEHKPGVFLLRDSKEGHVKHVGLVSDDLRELLVINGDQYLKRYPFYSFRNTNNGDLAFELACRFYHQYVNTLEKCAHPTCPPGDTLTCPVHSCEG